MFNDLVRNWWVLLIRGICAILFGILAFMWPGLTLVALVLLFGAYALIDGITSIVMGFSGRAEGRSWWPMFLIGLLGIAAGIVTFAWPGLTALALLVIIACWAIVRGIFEIVAAIRLRRVIEHEWLLVLSGILSILFGAILLTRPLVGALAMTWIIASYAIVFGILTVALSFRLLGMKRRAHPTTGGPMPRPA